MNIEEGKGRGGYPVYNEGRPTPGGSEPLCCGGLGVGWVLFILGFFLGVIPWYVGAIMLCCTLKDYDQREKPGLVACAIAAVLATIVLIIVVIVSANNNN